MVAKNVVGLFIAVLLIGSLLPTAITGMFTANTTDWDAQTVAIWTVLGVIIAIGVMVLILKTAGVNVGL